MDINNLRERNKELSERLYETNNQLFRALMDPIHNQLLNPDEEKFQINNRKNDRIVLEVDEKDDIDVEEVDGEKFEDAREETSQQTQTSSEDKHSITENEIEDRIKLRKKNNRDILF